MLHTQLGRELLAFVEALNRELDATMGDVPAGGRGRERYSYLARGIYADQLEAWMRHYPRDRLLVVQSERFFADPAPVQEEVVAFLGLPSAPLPAYEKFNEARYAGKLPTAVRERLVDYFRPHNERLWKLLGATFDWN